MTRQPLLRITRLLLSAVAFLAVAGGATAAAADTAAAAACGGAQLVPTAANLHEVEAATLCLIDQQRATHRLRRLRADPRLRSAAEAHAVQMVTRNYFDHVGPAGDTPLARAVAAGYSSSAGIREIGENIAAASGSLATPAQTVASWMRSPSHRAQILNPAFRDTGIGVTPAVPASLGFGPSGATYAEDFGTRQ